MPSDAHPLRGPDRRPHPVLEVIGTHASACWTRCTQCGRWFWLETDTSRFQYEDEWELDATDAERAFRDGRPEDVIALLTAHGLPRGPLWELASARAALFVALTPSATEDARIAALEGASLDAVWSRALAQRTASRAALTRAVAIEPQPFAIDLTGDLGSLRGFGEIDGAVFLARAAPPHAIVRVTAEQVVEIPVAGPCGFGVACGDGVIFHVAGPEADGLIRFGPDAMIPLALESPGPRYLAGLDDGHLFIAPAGPVGGGERKVEIRDAALAFVASFSVHLPHHESTPSHPRRVDGGWLASGVIDTRGVPLALVRFDDRFAVVAASTDARGPRHDLTPLGDDRFLARQEGAAFEIELWAQREAHLERVDTFEARGARFVADTIVHLDRRGGVFGRATDGEVRWREDFTAHGASYLGLVGEHAVVYSDGRAALFRVADGARVAEIDEPFPLTFHRDGAGDGYLLGGPSVLRIDRAGRVERTELDAAYAFATTIGDAMVLADRVTPGRYVVVRRDGALHEFVAPGARFSVVTTRGGPYVLEPERLRIGRFA